MCNEIHLKGAGRPTVDVLGFRLLTVVPGAYFYFLQYFQTTVVAL